MIQPELFLGLSDTAWTAISAICTGAAVIVALYFPISEKFNRRSKIFLTIENEIRNNFRVLEKARVGDISALVGQPVPRWLMIAVNVAEIKMNYWEDNSQFVSETSTKRFEEYFTINDDLNELRLLAREVLSIPDSRGYESKVLMGFEKVYSDMKRHEKYWAPKKR